MRRYISAAAFLLAALTTAISGSNAWAENFNIPGGDLDSALDAYTTQSGVAVIVSNAAVKGTKTSGVKGDLDPTAALARLLRGTGFIQTKDSAGVIQIVHQTRELQRSDDIGQIELAQASPSPHALETVTVTSSKIGGDVQNIPIAITALSQEQLTATQTAGGPDLIKQVPNMTFTKTNFSGLRGGA
jgi:iron complex outermembrane recepter protein